jgi:isoquinoline 1-oxidoreductase alpha subunit
MIAFTLNGKPVHVDVPRQMPLLWVLRETLRFTGTKFGCGAGLCGACTVHVGGEATRSCLTEVGAVEGQTVTTIEGLGRGKLHILPSAATASRARS